MLDKSCNQSILFYVDSSTSAAVCCDDRRHHAGTHGDHRSGVDFRWPHPSRWAGHLCNHPADGSCREVGYWRQGAPQRATVASIPGLRSLLDAHPAQRAVRLYNGRGHVVSPHDCLAGMDSLWATLMPGTVRSADVDACLTLGVPVAGRFVGQHSLSPATACAPWLCLAVEGCRRGSLDRQACCSRFPCSPHLLSCHHHTSARCLQPRSESLPGTTVERFWSLQEPAYGVCAREKGIQPRGTMARSAMGVLGAPVVARGLLINGYIMIFGVRRADLRYHGARRVLFQGSIGRSCSLDHRNGCGGGYDCRRWARPASAQRSFGRQSQRCGPARRKGVCRATGSAWQTEERGAPASLILWANAQQKACEPRYTTFTPAPTALLSYAAAHTLILIAGNSGGYVASCPYRSHQDVHGHGYAESI
jgi:hypothetical protein